MALKSIKGGYALSSQDETVLNVQKALTREVNEKFIQVGATFLKPASKFPVDEDWFRKMRGDVDLQAWVDAEELQPLNVGFNLQQGWMDVDIDASDPEFNECIVAAMTHLEVDTRFSFGRMSVGVPTHVLVQLPEDDSRNFDELRKFEPREFRIGGNRYHVQLRSFPTGTDAKNLVKSAKQTVVPGSVYSAKRDSGGYDLSVWYGRDRSVATDIRQIAETTPKKCTYSALVRAVAFGTALYVVRSHWIEGGRQTTAQKFTGWLARIVSDSIGINEHEVLATEVFCPIDSDAMAESLLRFICTYQNDDETFMRVRAYYDAREKLSRNPDAKVPGWHSMQEMVGADSLQALRTVIMPGNDVSKLTQFVERYVYDETDNKYIDRTRHATYGIYCHDGAELERRHKGDVIFINGKPREAFKVFESSTLRKRVGFRDMHPELGPGTINRIDVMGNAVPDDAEQDASVVFNTWRGFKVGPVDVVDPVLMADLIARLDKMLGLLTQDNAAQIDWVKKWIAWIFQHPGRKQQIAWVVMGGQGVGKSFFGNIFMKALLTEKLAGTASPKILNQNFTISPFKEKMFVFIDEASFHGVSGAVDEVKKLIRNTDINGMEKFEEARDYKIFARMMFASNRYDINVSDRDVSDRALFYTKAYTHHFLKMSQVEFNVWALTLKPFFEEFNELLFNQNVIAHFVRYFMDLECNRHEIESIELSSSRDVEVVEGNMSWARRVAKTMIEEGYIAAEDMEFEQPFSQRAFFDRANEVSKMIGISNTRPDAVLTEFRNLGLFETLSGKVNLTRPIKKWGSMIDDFQNATGLVLRPYRDLTDDDYGDNDNDGAMPRKRKGIRPGLSGKF